MSQVVVYYNPQFKQPVTSQNLDVQQQSAVDEPRNGWIPNPLQQRYRPQYALFYYHQWAEDVQSQSATNEPRDGWVPRPLQRPYHPQPWLLEFSEDTSQSAPVVTEGNYAVWRSRRLQQPFHAMPWVYEFGEDTSRSAPVAPADDPISWTPRPVFVAYNARPSLYWVLAMDLAPVPPAPATVHLPMHWMRRLELLNLRQWGAN